MPDSHIPPASVTSPRLHWSLIAVLDEGSAEDVALSLGRWDGEPTLAMRWNGDDSGNPIGNPQSRGLPTWFILPTGRYTEAIITALPPDKVALVRNFIPAA
jgi:hypothetical protein